MRYLAGQGVQFSFGKAMQIVGQVMQTLVEPEPHRTVRFITAILRNASTGDAEVIFENRQFARDRWGAKIDFENDLPCCPLM